MRAALAPLTNPRSVAIVGVSQRPDAIGTRVLKNLRMMGYAGTVYPVNPRYDNINGTQCWPSLSALPGKVDAAFLAVPIVGAFLIDLTNSALITLMANWWR